MVDSRNGVAESSREASVDAEGSTKSCTTVALRANRSKFPSPVTGRFLTVFLSWGGGVTGLEQAAVLAGDVDWTSSVTGERRHA